ncbi:amino acid transporter [Apiospora arundinis]
MFFLHRQSSIIEEKSDKEAITSHGIPSSRSESLKFVSEAGGNDAPSTYQIATGVYSTPSSVLGGTGSVGLSMIYWMLGGIISLSSAAVYLEFTSYFPSRSGAEVVYLEQAFPYPRFFFPTTYAIQKVIMSFKSSNCIVLANYLFATAGRTGSNWETKGVALAGYTVVLLAVVFHTKYSYYLSNAIGIVKLITLVFIAVTGLVILGGHTQVPDPKEHFANSLQGAATPYGITIALYRIIYSYGGWSNAFNVANEIKNPVAQIKRNGTISILIVTMLYILANVAYVAAVGKEKLKDSGTIAATLFFRAVFGESRAVQGLNFLIALSSFGNLLASMLGAARMLRECGRQGVLPCTQFWVSTKPFNTPLGPYLLDWGLTAIVILAIPAGDAFNFVADLALYPGAAFSFMAAVGLYIVRRRRSRAGLPRPQFKAWHPVIIFNILVHLYLLVMPWYPPADGKADVSFWYGTYIVTGLGILAACGTYYGVWVHAIPRWRRYKLRQVVADFGNGAQACKVVKVPVSDVAEWDATHRPGR